MGNPAVPPQLRLLRSTIGPVSHSKKPHVANIPRTTPPMPDRVKRDPLAAAEWRRITPVLARARLLHVGSQSPLALYCLGIARALRAHDGHAAGTVSAREVVEADRAARAWAGTFGMMTPSSEGVLSPLADTLPDDDDPFA